MFNINLNEAFQQAADFVGDVADDVMDGVQDAAEAVSDGAEAVVGQVIDGVEDAVETVEQIGTEVGTAVVGAAEAAAETAEEIGTSVVNNVASAVTSFLAAAAQPLRNAGESLAKAAYEAVDGVVDGVGMFVDGLGDIFLGTAGKLLEGDLIGAGETLIKGVDKVAFRSGQRLVNGLINATEDVFKAPTHLLPDPVGSFLRDQVVARTADIGRTLYNVPAQLSRNAFRTMTEAPFEVVKGSVRAVEHLLNGEFGDAAADFGMGFVNAGSRVVGDVVDGLMIGLQGAANVVGTALFLHEPSRPLTDEEKALLREHYGDSLDVDSIRVHEDNITTKLGMAAHAVGNDIYIDSSDSGSNTPLLVHEAAHVWQSQNGGNDYIHKALLAMGIAVVETGSRNGAYNWRQAVNDGKTFDEMNPEEQASLIESVEVARNNDTNGVLERSDFSPELTEEQWEAVQAALEDYENGDNAP